MFMEIGQEKNDNEEMLSQLSYNLLMALPVTISRGDLIMLQIW